MELQKEEDSDAVHADRSRTGRIAPEDQILAGELVTTMYTDFNEATLDNDYIFAETHLDEYIRNGEPQKIAQFLMVLNDKQIPMGKMADDALRTVQDVFITSVAVARHIAVEEGMNPQLANSICDAYCRNVERRTDIDGIKLYIFQMMMDYASRIRKLREFRTQSPLVRAVITDVSEHLYQPQPLREMASRLGYSREHLCRTFKKETGITLLTYIMQQKTAEAKIQLRYTNYSIAEIAENLGFSSQSYFQKVFLRYAGTTPGAFRKMSGNRQENRSVRKCP